MDYLKNVRQSSFMSPLQEIEFKNPQFVIEPVLIIPIVDNIIIIILFTFILILNNILKIYSITQFVYHYKINFIL